MFVSLEGIDSVGKTSLCEILSKRLSDDYDVSVVSDPPAIAPWDELRGVLLSDRTIVDGSRAMIFLAARIDAFARIIKPLLRQKTGLILADRFIDSWFAYQSVKNRQLFKSMRAAVGFFTSISSICVNANLLSIPDRTFLITADVATAVKRGKGKTRTVFDDLRFQREVQRVSLRLARMSKERFEIISSKGQPMEEVADIIETRVRRLMKSR